MTPLSKERQDDILIDERSMTGDYVYFRQVKNSTVVYVESSSQRGLSRMYKKSATRSAYWQTGFNSEDKRRLFIGLRVPKSTG